MGSPRVLPLPFLLAVILMVWWRQQIDPVTLPSPPAFISAFGSGDLALNTIGVYLYPEDDATSPAAAMMGAAGARWTRSWLSWDLIEPVLTDPPSYQWEYTDAILTSARNAGLEPIFLLGGNARWAADSFCGPLHPQAEDDFQRFLGDLVERYSAPPFKVRLWEIYNEPDSVFGPQGFCFGARGHLYPHTLRLAYEAIKAADPAAVVLFGGISYDFFINEDGRFDPAFLDDALAAGAGPYFDVLAFHYYPAFAERWAPFGPGVAGKAAYLRQELARYGLDKPLALTEIGRPTRGPESDGWEYSEIATARFVAPALALARVADLAPIIWFTAVDKPAEPYDYGLLDANLRPEPSFAAYRAVLPALQGASYQGELPMVGQGHALEFSQTGRSVIVAWAESGAALLELETPYVWSVDREGRARLISDGQVEDLDRHRNGRLRLLLTADPVILWLPSTPLRTSP